MIGPRKAEIGTAPEGVFEASALLDPAADPLLFRRDDEKHPVVAVFRSGFEKLRGLGDGDGGAASLRLRETALDFRADERMDPRLERAPTRGIPEDDLRELS